MPNHSFPPFHCSILSSIVPFVCNPKFCDSVVSHLKAFWKWWVDAFNKSKLLSAMSSEQDYSQARWNPDWLQLELVEEASNIMTKVLRDLLASCENIKSSAWQFWLQCLFCTWVINLIIPPACAESVKGCVYFIVGDRKGFPGGSVVKNLPAMQETKGTWVRSLTREDPLEEGMANHSSILAWRIP